MDKFGTFDIEAKDWTKFEIMGFFDGEKYQEFYSVSGFIDAVLLRRYRGYRFYAHFAGRYDFLFLLQDLLERKGYQVRIIDVGSSRIIQIVVSRGKDSWYFQDSWALLQSNLDALTRAFGVRYKKKKFDHSKSHKTKKGREYLKHDVIGLYEVLEKYADFGSNEGKLRLTAASQAMYIFRKNYLKDRLHKLGEKQEEFIRRSYYGGRCEIFKTYGKDLNYYDVNSMYPFVMLNEFPIGRAYRVNSWHSGRVGFYRVFVRVPVTSKIGFIPFISDAGKLLFPCGAFHAFVSNIELEQMKVEGIKFKVLSGFEFKKKKPIFRQYVKEHYKIKQSAEKGSALALYAKNSLNHLYGKFAQRRDREEIIKVDDFKRITKEKLTPYFETLGLYKKASFSNSDFILPHIAAYVTSLARMELYKIMKMAGFDNVYYCDTDSVITSITLPTSKELGGLKLEYKVKEAVFLQPKMYALRVYDENGKIKIITRMKGFNNQKIPFSAFKKIVDGGDLNGIRLKVPRMIGYRESLNKFGDVRPVRIEQPKQLRSVYDKRIINADYSTSPININ